MEMFTKSSIFSANFLATPEYLGAAESTSVRYLSTAITLSSLSNNFTVLMDNLFQKTPLKRLFGMETVHLSRDNSVFSCHQLRI